MAVVPYNAGRLIKPTANALASDVSWRASRAVAKYAVKKYKQYQAQKSKKNQQQQSLGKRYRELSHDQSVKFKHKKVKSILNKKIKGVGKKFAKKVTKVIQHSDNFGVHKYIGTHQYRQVLTDIWGVFEADRLGNYITLNDPRSITDAASQLWGVKAITDNFTATTNNLQPEIPIEVLGSSIYFYFKSTSSHVINIEVYECTAKKNTSVSPVDKASERYQDKYIRYLTSAGAISALSVTSLGWAPHMSTNMLAYYSVKKHKVKLLPGASSQLGFRMKARKYTFGSEDDDAVTTTVTIPTYTKGTKVFFFRLLNDATVSAAPNPGLVHHFASNDQGGVAMTYTRTYRIKPIKGTGIGATADQVSNKYIVVDTHSGTAGTDQQVAYENPVTSAPIG